MLAVTRKLKIKEIIQEQKSVTVSALSKKFSVTEETIRRDLKALEKEGTLNRTYGGAFIQDGVQNDINIEIRETVYIKEKNIIAEKAKKLISNGDSIFLDGSTTALFICNTIKDMRITVLTNSLKIMNSLSESENISLITVGGKFYKKNMDFIGAKAIETIQSYFLDKAFVSCRSLSIENGITDSNEYISEIRKTVISRSAKSYVIADNSKFNKTSFLKVSDFSDIDGVITDSPLDKDWNNFLNKNNVYVY